MQLAYLGSLFFMHHDNCYFSTTCAIIMNATNYKSKKKFPNLAKMHKLKQHFVLVSEFALI